MQRGLGGFPHERLHQDNVSHLPISLSPYLPISLSPHTLPCSLFPVPCSL
ncbi:hypothetical protein [Moorena sp. SIO3H5]|nr:hypothetical protein [Moorena sp. SIO3H5]